MTTNGIAPAPAGGEAAAGFAPLDGPAAAPSCARCGGAELVQHRSAPICAECLRALQWRLDEVHRALRSIDRALPLYPPTDPRGGCLADLGWAEARDRARDACMDATAAIRALIGVDTRPIRPLPPLGGGLNHRWTGD